MHAAKFSRPPLTLAGLTALALAAGCSGNDGNDGSASSLTPFGGPGAETTTEETNAANEEPNATDEQPAGSTGGNSGGGAEEVPTDAPLVESEEPAGVGGNASEESAAGEQPAAVEPPPATEPSVEEPNVEEPSVEEPSVEEPSIEEPSIEEPLVPVAALDDYFVSGDWRGFVAARPVFEGTTVDFEFPDDGEPFCISGTVAGDPDFGGAARLEFNLNQSQEASALPETVVPSGNGLAFTFSRTTGAMLRVQLESAVEEKAWCYSIPEVRGPAFVPYSALNTECYSDGSPTGENYAGEPVETLVFEVPGNRDAELPYDFCVAGFNDAQSVDQAPTAPDGMLSGSIEGTLSETDQRGVVEGDNGQKYVVFNNAWGGTSFDGSQLISYRNNSFRIERQAAPSNGNVPVSFPSIFLGGSGYNGGDNALATRVTDRMPAQVSTIESIPTRFAHNATSGDYNATYDVWFQGQALENGYETATAAFLMVWTYKPNRSAIGSVVADNVNIAGHGWQLVAGRRGDGGDANAADADSAVISYITTEGSITDLEFDLMDFIDDAAQRSQSGQLNGQRFDRSMFLTDIFAGFEIWNGGAGLEVQAFDAEVVLR